MGTIKNLSGFIAKTLLVISMLLTLLICFITLYLLVLHGYKIYLPNWATIILFINLTFWWATGFAFAVHKFDYLINFIKGKHDNN